MLKRRVALGILFCLALSAVAFAQDDPAKPAAVADPEKQDERAERNDTRMAATYKSCMMAREKPSMKRTYTPHESEDYCGCFAAKAVEFIPFDEWQASIDSDGKHPQLKRAIKYCAERYLNLPDVKKIKERKW